MIQLLHIRVILILIITVASLLWIKNETEPAAFTQGKECCYNILPFTNNRTLKVNHHCILLRWNAAGTLTNVP